MCVVVDRKWHARSERAAIAAISLESCISRKHEQAMFVLP